MNFNTTAILNWAGNQISNLSQKGLNALSQAGANPSPLIIKLVPFFVGAALIWVGSMVTKKVAKFAMIIIGLILVIVIGYSFIA